MTSTILNTTQSIIKKVYKQLNRDAHVQESPFSLIEKTQINPIFHFQQKEKYTSANKMYKDAGFEATSITARMVQNQIAAVSF